MWNVYHPYNNGNLRACPYTSLIPLGYVYVCDGNYYNSHDKLSEYVRQIISRTEKGKTIEQLQLYYHRYESSPQLRWILPYVTNMLIKERSKENIYREIANYVSFSGTHSIEAVCGANRAETLTQFTVDYRKGYSGYVNMSNYKIGCDVSHGVYLKENDGYIPYVFPVILPKHLMAARLHVVNRGEVDKSMVMFLINTNLYSDRVTGGFKRACTGLIEYIKELGYATMDVPEEYIYESCFINGIGINKSTITERKTKHEEMVRVFYNSLQEEEEYNDEDNEYTEEEEEYDEQDSSEDEYEEVEEYPPLPF